MRIRYRAAIISGIAILAFAIAAVAFISINPGLNSISCSHLCIYRTTFGNGVLSIWLAWDNLPIRNAKVGISSGGSSIVNAISSASGAISIYTPPGFSGGNITAYYRGYAVSDYVHEYPYTQGLVYLLIGVLAYTAIKRISNHGLSSRRVSISIDSKSALRSTPNGILASTENLQRSIAISALERLDAIKYHGIVADLDDVCKRLASQENMNVHHSASLRDEVDAAIHFRREELNAYVVDGTIYSSSSAISDSCARHLYDKALYSGVYSVPNAPTTDLIIGMNTAGMSDGLNLGRIITRLTRRSIQPKPIAVRSVDKPKMLYRASMPRRRESAFMLMYLSGNIGVVYV